MAKAKKKRPPAKTSAPKAGPPPRKPTAHERKQAQTPTAGLMIKRASGADVVIGLVVLLLMLFIIFPSGQITYFTKFSKTFFAGVFVNLTFIALAATLILKRRAMLLNWGVLLLAGYTVYLAIVAQFYPGYYTSYYISKYLTYINIMLLAANVVSVRSLQTINRAIALSIALLAAFWLAGVAGLFDDPDSRSGLFFKSLHFGVQNGQRMQLELTFGNPNMFGSFLALMMPIVVTGLFAERSKLWRGLFALVVLAILAMAFRSESRNAIIMVPTMGAVAVIAGCALYFSDKPLRILVPFAVWGVLSAVFGASVVLTRMFGVGFIELSTAVLIAGGLGLVLIIGLIAAYARQKRRYFAVVGGYLLVVFLLQQHQALVSDRVQQKFSTTGTGQSEAGRSFAYQAAWDIYTSSPASIVFGRGPGSLYAEVFALDPGTYDNTNTNKSYLFAHQENLEIALQGGLVGSAIHYGLALVTVAICLLAFANRERPKGERLFALALAVALGAFYFFGLFSLAVRYSATEFPYHIILALAWALYGPWKQLRLPFWAWSVPLLLGVAATVDITRIARSDNLLITARVDRYSRSHDDPRRIDSDEFQQRLREAVDAYPDNIHAKTELFRAAAQRRGGGDMAMLDELYEDIENQIPLFKEIPYFYGRLAFSAGRSEEAVRIIAGYVDTNRFSYDARALLAGIHLAQGEREAFERRFAEIMHAAVDHVRFKSRIPMETRLEQREGEWVLHVRRAETSALPAFEHTVSIGEYARDLATLDREELARFGQSPRRVNRLAQSILSATVRMLRSELRLPVPTDVARAMGVSRVAEERELAWVLASEGPRSFERPLAGYLARLANEEVKQMKAPYRVRIGADYGTWNVLRPVWDLFTDDEAPEGWSLEFVPTQEDEKSKWLSLESYLEAIRQADAAALEQFGKSDERIDRVARAIEEAGRDFRRNLRERMDG